MTYEEKKEIVDKVWRAIEKNVATKDYYELLGNLEIIKALDFYLKD